VHQAELTVMEGCCPAWLTRWEMKGTLSTHHFLPPLLVEALVVSVPTKQGRPPRRGACLLVAI